MTTLPAPFALGGTLSIPLTPELPEPSVSRRIGHIRIGHITAYIFLSLLIAIMFVYAGFHAYIAWKLSHPNVAYLLSNPMLSKNLPYTDVTFPSADGRSKLDGWWIPVAHSERTVVLSHGYGANREENWVPMYDLADMLHRLGYNVLMFDYGFANKNHRLPATGGVLESQQLLGAIHYAHAQGTDELVVWGFSMGAGTALQAALQHAPVDAMILDSTFLPNEDTLYFNLNQGQLKLPKYPTVPFIRWFLPLMTGTPGLDQIPSAIAMATNFDFPIYLIHGTADSKAPSWLAENVAKAQTNPFTQLWIVPNAIHEMIFRTHTQEYIRRVTSFLEQVHTSKMERTHIISI